MLEWPDLETKAPLILELQQTALFILITLKKNLLNVGASNYMVNVGPIELIIQQKLGQVKRHLSTNDYAAPIQDIEFVGLGWLSRKLLSSC